MITVLLANDFLDFKIRRYNTDFFDEAAIMLIDDWRAGKIGWESEEIIKGFTPEWLNEWGYPDENVEPEFDEENEVANYHWHWQGESESDDVLVYGYFFKTTSVNENEWPTKGISSPMFGEIE